MRTNLLRQSLGVVIGAAAVLAASGSVADTTKKSGETLGFVVSKFYPATYRGENNCPDGFAMSPQESFTSQLPAAERVRLLKPENAAEYEELYKWTYATGPNGEEMCRDPKGFKNKYEHPPNKMIQGKTSYGMDLDGNDGSGAPPPGICKHENFTSPEGVAGVDNQLFRANGCHAYYRGSLTDPNIVPGIDYYNRLLKEGLHTIVIEITGVDDRQNDNDIQVGVYSSPDKPAQAGNKLLHHASLTITTNPKWQNVYKAKIVNGKITTEAKDLRLNMEWSVGGERGASEEYDMRRARFEMEITPEGELKGLMGAYQELYNVMSIYRIVGAGSSAVAAFECASEYKALEMMADGYPDENGKCTAISLAYELNAVPAFLIHKGDRANVNTAQKAP